VLVASRPKVSFWADCSTSPGNYGWLFVDPRFLYFGTSWRSASRPIALLSGKWPPYLLDRNWLGPWAGLDDMEKWKFLALPWFELWPLGDPDRSQ
jgi:hypothetical protein